MVCARSSSKELTLSKRRPTAATTYNNYKCLIIHYNINIKDDSDEEITVKPTQDQMRRTKFEEDDIREFHQKPFYENFKFYNGSVSPTPPEKNESNA